MEMNRRGFLGGLLMVPAAALAAGWKADPTTDGRSSLLVPRADSYAQDTIHLPSRVTCLKAYRDRLYIGTEHDGLWCWADGWLWRQYGPAKVTGIEVVQDRLIVFDDTRLHWVME